MGLKKENIFISKITVTKFYPSFLSRTTGHTVKIYNNPNLYTIDWLTENIQFHAADMYISFKLDRQGGQRRWSFCGLFSLILSFD